MGVPFFKSPQLHSPSTLSLRQTSKDGQSRARSRFSRSSFDPSTLTPLSLSFSSLRSSPGSIATLIIGVLLFPVFFYMESRAGEVDALIRPSLWKIPNFLLITLYSFSLAFWYFAGELAFLSTLLSPGLRCFLSSTLSTLLFFDFPSSILTFFPFLLPPLLPSGQVTYSIIFQDIWNQSAIMTAVRFLPSSISGVRESRLSSSNFELRTSSRCRILLSFAHDPSFLFRNSSRHGSRIRYSSHRPPSQGQARRRIAVGWRIDDHGEPDPFNFLFPSSEAKPAPFPFHSSPSPTIRHPTGNSSSSVSRSVLLVSFGTAKDASPSRC